MSETKTKYDIKIRSGFIHKLRLQKRITGDFPSAGNNLSRILKPDFFLLQSTYLADSAKIAIPAPSARSFSTTLPEF